MAGVIPHYVSRSRDILLKHHRSDNELSFPSRHGFLVARASDPSRPRTPDLEAFAYSNLLTRVCMPRKSPGAL